MYTVISREGCSFCVKAKDLLTQKYVEFTEKIVDVDITRDYVRARFPEITVLPIILDSNDNLIGGFPELIDHLNPTEF